MVLVLHVTASAGWIGVEACLLALCVTALGPGGRQAVPAYLAAGQLGSLLAFPACLLSLATGLLLALGTPWGLLRYYWVLIKFLLTSAVMLADLLTVNHLLGEAAAKAALPAAGGAGPALAAACAGHISTLLAAMLLAIFKPWGRTGYQLPAPRSLAGRTGTASAADETARAYETGVTGVSGDPKR